MITIHVPEIEYYDEEKEEFGLIKAQNITLEHSLVSIDKWESMYKRPFLVKDPPKTREETLDYIRCMTITQNVDPLAYNYIPKEEIDRIEKYIDDPMTATTIKEDPNKPPSREIITAELVYYWMIALQIPWECRKWHFNKLITLIRVCNIKNDPHPKKLKGNKLLSRNRALNEARIAKMRNGG